MKESKKELVGLLKHEGVPVSTVAAERLWLYYQLLHEHNQDRDLSRLVNYQDIFIKHFLDSALLLIYKEDLPSPLLDMGTGAGFPGIVLKILSPDTEVILGEVRRKRVAFLKRVITELELCGIETYGHRIGPTFALPVEGVVARAFASVEDTLKRVRPFLPEGGLVIMYKGPAVENELDLSESSLQREFALSERWHYHLAASGHERSLVVYRREKEGLKLNQKVGEWPILTSPANSHVKRWRSLTESRGQRKHGEMILSGEKYVAEFLARREQDVLPQVRAFLWPEGYGEGAQEGSRGAFLYGQGQLLKKTGVRIACLPKRLFGELDCCQTRAPLLILQSPEIDTWQGSLLPNALTVFLPLQDPGNLGTAIRSAVAFGVKQVVLLAEAANPFHPKALRAAGISLFYTHLRRGPSLPELFEHYSSLPIAKLESGGEDVALLRSHGQKALLLGIEGPGYSLVPQETRGCFPSYGIAIDPVVESLNTAASLAVALHSYASQSTGDGFEPSAVNNKDSL